MTNNSSENIDPIEDFFRKRFEGEEELPNSMVWDAISAKLDEIQTKKIPFWKKNTFQLSVGAIIGIAIFTYLYFSKDVEEPKSKSAPKKTSILNDTKKASTQNSTEKVLPIVSSTKSIDRKHEQIKASQKEQKRENILIEETKNENVSDIITEEIPIEQPMKEEKIIEPELVPDNLYEQLKKEQKSKPKKELFIEKKE